MSIGLIVTNGFGISSGISTTIANVVTLGYRASVESPGYVKGSVLISLMADGAIVINRNI